MPQSTMSLVDKHVSELLRLAACCTPPPPITCEFLVEWRLAGVFIRCAVPEQLAWAIRVLSFLSRHEKAMSLRNAQPAVGYLPFVLAS